MYRRSITYTFYLRVVQSIFYYYLIFDRKFSIHFCFISLLLIYRRRPVHLICCFGKNGKAFLAKRMIGYECLVVKGSFRSLLLIREHTYTVYGSEGTYVGGQRHSKKTFLCAKTPHCEETVLKEK